MQFVFAPPCAALSGCCDERRTEISGDDAPAVELAQNMQIIEISHAGVLVVVRDTTVSSFSTRTVSGLCVQMYAQISIERSSSISLKL